MNENSGNIKNEETKGPIYSSEFLLNKELYYDFSLVNYNRTKKMFLIFLCLVSCLTGKILLNGNYDILLWFSPSILFLMILIYFKTKKTIKIGYERMVILQGKEMTVKYELYDDKFVSYNEERKKDCVRIHSLLNIYAFYLPK